MPSFIAHSVAGIAIYQIAKRDWTAKKNLSAPSWITLPILAVIFANLPDLDFIPQLLTGIRYHHGATHSLLVWLGIGIGTWTILRSLPRIERVVMTSIVTFAYGSHLLLDYLSAGGSGIQLLWPFSTTYWKSPYSVFPAVDYSKGLISLDHLTFIISELIFAIIVMGLIYAGQRILNQRSERLAPSHSSPEDPLA